MKKSQLQLLSDFADASDELLKLKVISTDSFTGEIGEFTACYFFKLNKAKKVTKDIDASDINGNHYQVKSKIVSNGNFGYRLSGLNPKAFKYLIVVYFDEMYNPLRILKIDSKAIPGTEFNIPSSIQVGKFISLIEGNSIKFPTKKKSAINKFALAYNALKTQRIIRTRHVVGDLGEFYACEKLGLKINERTNEKGIDAIHPTNGLTFEVKTRRVYQSERRDGEGRRLNGLTGKSADYLVVVTLDREFKCSGMWLMPMKNILNPKSAHLTIVNNTKGVESVVPSQIDWLKTAKMFQGFNKIGKVSSKSNPIKEAYNTTVKEANKTKIKSSNKGKPKPRKFSWMKDDDLEVNEEIENEIKTENYQSDTTHYIKQDSQNSGLLNFIWGVLKWLLIAAIIGSIYKSVM